MKKNLVLICSENYILTDMITHVGNPDTDPAVAAINKEQRRNIWKIIEMSSNNDYATGNLIDIVRFSNNYKIIVIDLSNQIELEDADTLH